MLVLGIFAASANQFTSPDPARAADWNAAFQYRPRMEIRGAGYGTPKIEGADAFAELSHRARVSLLFSQETLKGLAEVQDVRVFGEESDTLKDVSADGIDFHQAYLDYSFAAHGGLRVGRTELVYEEHRLLGNVDWAQQGRSHDAVVVRWTPERYSVHFAAAQNLGEDRLASAPYNKTYPAYTHYETLALLWGQSSALGHRVSLSVLFDDPKGANQRWTVGPRIEKADGSFVYRGELFFQTLKIADDAHRGMFLGVYAGPKLDIGGGRATLLAWYDLSSPGFQSLYPTAHKFFGHLDYFLAFPANVEGKGLHDPAIKLSANISGWTCGLDVHQFILVDDLDGKRNLGTEADLTVSRKLTDFLSLDLGASYFKKQSALESLKDRKLEDGKWAFVQMNAAFK